MLALVQLAPGVRRKPLVPEWRDDAPEGILKE